MKIAIVYHSEHHGNTKKLIDEIANQGDVVLIEASGGEVVNLSEYDLIGFASGNYYSKLHDSILKYAEKNLPLNKKVFLIYTYGVKIPKIDALERIFDEKEAQMLGVFGCTGFDTFGPFKLVGGLAKGHPNDDDVAEAVKFFKDVSKK